MAGCEYGLEQDEEIECDCVCGGEIEHCDSMIRY